MQVIKNGIDSLIMPLVSPRRPELASKGLFVAVSRMRWRFALAFKLINQFQNIDI
jgi:hypothetical protein